MKKLIMIAGIVFTLVSCKPKESDVKAKEDCCPCPDVAGAATNPLCDELSQLRTRDEIFRYIDNHRQELCNGTLNECILKVHGVSFKSFYDMVRDRWGTNAPVYNSYTWAQIKGVMGERCYPNYLGFDYDVNGRITRLTSLDAFPNQDVQNPPTAYSFPLFRAIDRKFNGLNDTDEFVFVVAKEKITVNGVSVLKEKVIFYFENKATGNTTFYNISDNPTKEL